MFAEILNILVRLTNSNIKRVTRNADNEILISKYDGLCGFGFVSYGNTYEEACKKSVLKFLKNLKWYYKAKVKKWLKLK
jgi:hypothetical protein